MIKTFIFTLFGSILLNSPSNSPATATDHFSISNKHVIWQKVFETPLSKKEIIQNIRYSGHFNDITVHDGYVTAQIPMLSLDFRGYEISTERTAPTFSRTHFIQSYLIIDFKENRYRVTLKSIRLMPRQVTGDDSEMIIDLEFIAINPNNGQFNQRFFNRRSKVLNHTFEQVTDFTSAVSDDDW